MFANALEKEIVETVAAATVEALGPGAEPDAIPALLTELVAVAEGILEHQAPPERPLDCRSGCNHCCRAPVEVTAPEVLALAAALLKRPKGLADLVEAEPRCPLLDRDGLCAVYDSRPFFCRASNSMDVAACQRGADVPIWPAWWSVHRHVQGGLLFGIAELGREADRLDLRPAIAIALSEPRAAERWLAGERLFESALLPSGTRWLNILQGR
ncbi:MAG: YkgJ family cysteine cluster protein [Alphaproteobacteria bacterium]|nr:YkgJ family cysteine cluster protein [Alphaproteobacteria bacterium]